MVKQSLLKFGIACIGFSLSAGSVRADTLLEQMQNEVATISGKARTCIVSIEDARAVVVSYNNSALEKSDLQNELAHLLIDRKAAQEQASRMEAQFQAGQISTLEVEKPRREVSRLDTRMAYLQQTLANFGREDLFAQQKREREARIAELEIDRKFYAEQIKALEQQVSAGAASVPDLQAVQQQQAHVLQDLKTAQEARNAQLPTVTNALIIQWDNQRMTAPKSGSGFSVGNGYIVTTADVAQGMSSPIVTTDDGRRIRAMLIAIDSERNVGLVRLAANATLPALTLGDSDRVMPGHFAIAIGNQAGQYNSVALGLVSGLRSQGFYSDAHFYPNLLQVDGAVGAGTSGAPILNARGEVIGMIAATLAPDTTPVASNGNANISASDSKNTLRYFNNGTAVGDAYLQRNAGNQTMTFVPDNRIAPPRPLTMGTGTGFAIPINAMKDVVEELKAGKDIVHTWFGVALENVDDAREDNGAIRLNSQARIRGIYANSPALKVGMKPGDVLVSLDSKPVHTTSEVRAAILPMKAGRKVAVVVKRADKMLTFDLTLELQPTPRPNLLPNIMLNGPVFQLNGKLQSSTPPAAHDKKMPGKP